MEEKKYYAYMLLCSDGTVYSGFTTDPVRRERMHNEGKAAKYTRTRRPVRMIYVESFTDKSSALKREAAFKKMSHDEKLALAKTYLK